MDYDVAPLWKKCIDETYIPKTHRDMLQQVLQIEEVIICLYLHNAYLHLERDRAYLAMSGVDVIAKMPDIETWSLLKLQQ